jgi:predicted nuclease with TOPRIM domain
MALTEVEKEANKQAQSIRNGAYRQRLSERNAAVSIATDKTNMLEERKAVSKNHDEFNAIMAERNSREDAVRKKIAELQDSLKSLSHEYDLKFEEAKARRDVDRKAFDIKADEIQSDLDARFSDLKDCGCHGVAKWIPPQGYVEKYTEENAGDLAKKIAKRAKSRP